MLEHVPHSPEQAHGHSYPDHTRGLVIHARIVASPAPNFKVPHGR